MVLEQTPFKAEKLEVKQITFTVRITEDMYDWFYKGKKLIQQSKNSTAIKQLAKIGFNHVLHNQEMKEMLGIVLNNNKNNIRNGITPEEYKIDK